MSVMFIDTDKFKYIDDKCGHGMGDKVLKKGAKKSLKKLKGKLGGTFPFAGMAMSFWYFAKAKGRNKVVLWSEVSS